MTVDTRFCLIIIAAATVFCAPVLRPGNFQGHETAEKMIQRLVELDSQIKDGRIPPRWAPHFDHGLGTPFFMFYPPLFLYGAEMLHLCGLSFPEALNLTVVILCAIGGLGAYLFARLYFFPQNAFVTSMAYMFFPYRIMQIYIRGAYAEYSAGALLPFLFWAVAKCMKSTETKFGFYLAVLSALFMLTHNVIVLFTMPVLLLWIIVATYSKGVRKKLNVLSWLIAGLLISSYFWIPAFLETGFVQIERMRSGYFDVRVHFAFLYQLFQDRWGFGPSIAGPDDKLPLQIGIPWIVLAAAGLLQKRKSSRMDARDHYFFGAILLAGFVCNLSISGFLWKAISLLKFSQFPWRSLTLLALPLSLFIGNIPQNRSKSAPMITMTALVFSSIFVVYSFRYLQAPSYSFFPQEMINADVIQAGDISTTASREYTPRWMKMIEKEEYPDQVIRVVSGRIDLTDVVVDNENINFKCSVSEPVTIAFQRSFYPGWKLFAQDRPIPVFPGSDGLVTAEIPSGTHECRLLFGETPLRMVTNALSLLSIVAIIVIVNVRRFTRGV